MIPRVQPSRLRPRPHSQAAPFLFVSKQELVAFLKATRLTCPPFLFVSKQELVAFLKADLPHLFDDRGIDRSRYNPQMSFEDPLTQYSSLDGE